MVTVKNYKIRIGENKKEFILLELLGDIELVQSQNTGRFYATNRTCSISSTFDEATAKLMIGKQIPGIIARVEVEPYDFTIKETGEVIKLSHAYDYRPEGYQEPVIVEHDSVPA